MPTDSSPPPPSSAPSPSPTPASLGGVAVAAILLAVGAAGGWSLHRALHPAVAAEEHEAEAKASVHVTTAPIEFGDLTLAEPFFGAAAAEPTSLRTVSSRAGGLVLSVAVAHEQVVEAGQSLLQFDPAPLQAAALTARGALATAQNALREFERGGRERTEAELFVADAKATADAQQAEADVARLTPLRADGLVAEKTLADARFALQRGRVERAAAARALAAWQQNGAQLKLAELTAAEAAAAAALQQAELALAEADVKAPAAGRLINLAVRAGDKLEPFAPIGTLLLDERRLLIFSASAAAAEHIAVGAAITFRDPAGRERTGAIARVAGHIGLDGLVEVAATVDGTESLRPGAYVHGEVATEWLAGVAIVPAAAVLRLEGEDHVIVRTADGKSKKVVVEILGRRGDRTAIGVDEDSDDLEAGTRVVVEGGFNLKDGTELIEGEAKGDDDKDAKDAKGEKGEKGADAKDSKDKDEAHK